MLGTKLQEKLRQDNTSALNLTLLYPYASFMGKLSKTLFRVN